MASFFRKLTGRRKKTNPSKHTTEALSIATSHTSELDTESPNRPQHLNSESFNAHKKESGRGWSNDPSKHSVMESKSSREAHDLENPPRRDSRSGTPQIERMTPPRKYGRDESSQKDKNNIHGGSDPGDSKQHRSFHLGFQSQSATPTIQGSVSYDSEDETAATSTSTVQLMRGRKTQKQLAAQLSTAKSLGTTEAITSPAPVPKLSAEDIARQNAANKETERIARAAAALDSRGNDYFERGHYDKAMDAYSRALKLKRRTFHSMMEEADDLFDEVEENKKIDSDDKELDPKLLVSMATSINNIGYLRQRAGEATPDETMAAYKKSLRIKRKILGSDSLSVGKTLNNIGSVYYLKKEFDDAMPAYDEALTIMQANLGADHPDVATVISNMGDVNLALKKKSEALDHYRVALDIRWNAFGEKDPRTMRLLEKIARIEIGDQMPTPRGTKVQRQYYDWDESELYDLDLRPLSYELRLLKDQVKEDIEAVNLLEKKIAVGMVRDKVKIVRGMRELIEAQEHNHGSFNALQGSFSHDSSQHGEGSNHDYEDLLSSPGMLPAMTENQDDGHARVSPNTLSDTQMRVQERLAKLRAQKGLNPAGPLSLPLTESASMRDIKEKPVSEVVGPSNFLRSSLISTSQQPTRTALSAMKPEQIKEQVDEIESALKLKKGIDHLRSHVDNADDNADPISKTIASSVAAPNMHEIASVLHKRNSEVDGGQVPGNAWAEEPPPSCENTELEKKAATNEEVQSFFQNLMKSPAGTNVPQRKLVHATWLGAVPVEAGPPEPDTSMDDSFDTRTSPPKLAAPKLVHTTWLGEIES